MGNVPLPYADSKKGHSQVSGSEEWNSPHLWGQMFQGQAPRKAGQPRFPSLVMHRLSELLKVVQCEESLGSRRRGAAGA